MKKEIEITGILKIDSEKEIVVDLFSNGVKLDWFELNYKHKSINVELSDNIGKILKVDVNDYFDYIKLLDELGLEIPKSYKRHWTPAEEWDYYSIGQGGNVEGLGNYGELSSARFRKENYNAFPTRELAEKGVNASKLERLMLLWQYANDCLFEPDWLDGLQYKYYIIYDGRDKKVYHDYSLNHRLNNVHFETSEQAKAFVDMYSEEIKKIMGVI